MNISQRGVDLIKQFEGLYLEAYKNLGEEYWTIGYGTYASWVTPGMTCTEAQAEQWLREELAYFVERTNAIAVSKFPSLNQNQFDALVSYSYNRGPGGLIQLVNNSSSIQELGNNITVYWGSNTNYYNGLMNRRRQEQSLFFDGNVSPTQPDNPSNPDNPPAPPNDFPFNVEYLGLIAKKKRRMRGE